jgi:predicted transposase YbfD/YdcC
MKKLYTLVCSLGGFDGSFDAFRRLKKKLNLKMLRDMLSEVPDNRGKNGRRYSLPSMLYGIIIAHVLGARTLTNIHDILEVVNRNKELFGRGVPSISTIHLCIKNVGFEKLEEIVDEWSKELKDYQIVSFDGKELCGAKNGKGSKTMMLGAIDQNSQIVLHQSAISEKTNEIPMAIPLIKKLGRKNTIFTADALHTQVKEVEAIKEVGANYVLPVKGNQKTLLNKIMKLDWVNTTYQKCCEKGHGRISTWNIAKIPFIDDTFHSKWAIRIERGFETKDNAMGDYEYYITSLPDTPLDELFNIIRGHWVIENNLHWQRDYTFNEDKSQIRTGNGAKNMTVFRNIALNILKMLGVDKITRFMSILKLQPNLAIPLFRI